MTKCVRRAVGIDNYDDFKLAVMVFDAKAEVKERFCVRMTAGEQRVQTKYSSKGSFSEELHLQVAQGTDVVTIDIVCGRGVRDVVARRRLRVVEDLLDPHSNLRGEQTLELTPKRKGVLHPVVHLSMVTENAEETQFDTDYFLNREKEIMTKKRRASGASGGKGFSETELLSHACNGPVRQLTLGHWTMWSNKRDAHLHVVGPPLSRHWHFGLWASEQDVEQCDPITRVDLMRVVSVQADPAHDEQFYVRYYDESRSLQELVLRRVDRPRDVWVDMLQRMLGLVRKGEDRRDGGRTSSSAVMGTKSMKLRQKTSTDSIDSRSFAGRFR